MRRTANGRPVNRATREKPSPQGQHTRRETAGAAPKRAQVNSAIRDIAGDVRVLNTLFEGSPLGILVADYETKNFRYANPAICKMLGYTEQELLQLGVGEIHPREHMQRVSKEFAAQAQGDKFLASDMACLRKDGSVFTADVSATPVEVAGRLMVVGFFTDVTERKRAEEERKRLDMQLREAQKLEAVGRFGRGVAHDFNNLMATILGLASNMRSKRKPGDPDHTKLSQIEETAETAARLALQLLDFAKGGKVHPSLLSFSDVVKSALSLVPPILPQNVTLIRDLESDSWQVECDQTQLQQVILNVCRNALEAMPNGGRLTIKAENIRLATPLEDAQPPLAAGEHACLTIEDTGCGMDAETIKCIFDPFFTTKDSGHGLGLAAAYGVMAAHGGSISVKSEPGKGSEFRLWLPRAKRLERHR